MDASADRLHLNELLHEIEHKLQWGHAANWPNHLFDELSRAIQDKTGTLLSSSTLKRVWGRVKFEGKPSITTLNALAQYCGYRNWHDFTITESSHEPVSVTEPKRRSNIRVIVVSAAFLALIFISLFSMIGLPVPPAAWDSSLVTFSSRPLVQSIPNSVVFDIDLNECPSDSIYIQQYWDKTKTIKLHHSQKQATGIYYYPGYFRAKLLVDGEILQEHDLFIKSEDWLATIDYEPIPKYFNKVRIKKGLSFPPSALEEMRSIKDPVQTSFHLVQSFEDCSADNFSVSTKVKNKYADKWAVCQRLKIVLLGTRGAMVIPFTIPGCTSDINLMVNDVYQSGKENDLSDLGTSFTNSRQIDLEVHTKTLTVQIDGRPVLHQEYTESMGQFVGIRYRALGMVKVEELIIEDEKNNVVYDLQSQK